MDVLGGGKRDISFSPGFLHDVTEWTVGGEGGGGFEGLW